MADAGALRSRMTLGPILIAALAVIFWLDARAGATAPFLLALAILLTIRGLWEFADLLAARQLTVRFGFLCALGAAVVAANWAPVAAGWDTAASPLARFGPAMLAYAVAVMALFGNALARFHAPGGNLEVLAMEVLGLSYLAVFVSATAQLRWVASADLCYLPLASVVVVTKCGDTAAYFTGRAFGRRKLAPLISPGKTRAGGVGALVGAALGGWICLSVVPRSIADAVPAAAQWSLLYGVLIGGLGVVGDLAESLIKRDVGRKDSAPLLPGFGGLLDLLDSVIFVGPAAYLLWLVLPLARS
jgi:phosphatidate cytidylyltransferase